MNDKKIIFEYEDKSGNLLKITDTVVILPCMLAEFSNPLWNTNPISRSFQTRPWRDGEWKWINKGDLLTELKICVKPPSLWSMGKFIDVPIRSPISGIMFNSHVNFVTFHGSCEDGFFYNQHTYGNTVKILLPEGEVIPEHAGLMYAEFCDFCLKHKELFLKPEYSFSTEETLRNAVDKQSKAPIRTLSLSDDFSEDYIEELVTLKSSDLF